MSSIKVEDLSPWIAGSEEDRVFAGKIGRIARVNAVDADGDHYSIVVEMLPTEDDLFDEPNILGFGIKEGTSEVYNVFSTAFSKTLTASDFEIILDSYDQSEFDDFKNEENHSPKL